MYLFCSLKHSVNLYITPTAPAPHLTPTCTHLCQSEDGSENSQNTLLAQSQEDIISSLLEDVTVADTEDPENPISAMDGSKVSQIILPLGL